jgi:hypothetical protein
MEDVLDLYAEAYAPKRPVVCLDESPYQLVSEKREPIPAAPGQPVRYDYEYKREGTCNLFMFFQPLAGWRHVKVTERRTGEDFAHCLKDLVDIHFPDAAVIRLVTDQLNTHRPAVLYATFEPEEARRIARKLEWHYTPKHGSWLDMAEVELAVLSRQCLDRRIPDMETAEHLVGRWEERRNEARTTVEWQFTTDQAREKLERVYSS